MIAPERESMARIALARNLNLADSLAASVFSFESQSATLRQDELNEATSRAGHWPRLKLRATKGDACPFRKRRLTVCHTVGNMANLKSTIIWNVEIRNLRLS
jgi:hypothetical protein